MNNVFQYLYLLLQYSIGNSFVVVCNLSSLCILIYVVDQYLRISWKLMALSSSLLER